MDIMDIIKPQPKQLEALNMLLDPKCKYLLYGGAMSGGKSYVLRWGAIMWAIYLSGKYHKRNIPIGLFSEDYPTLKDRQISRIDAEMPKWLGSLKDDSINGLCFKINDRFGGGVILLRNLDDPSKYMSTEFASEFVEELTRDSYQTFEDLRNRLRYPGVDEVKFMAASNPGGIGHGWVRKYFISKATTDPEQNKFYYIHANVYDNKFISPTYIKQLESLPEQKRKAYLEGSWDVFAGQFFTEFDSRIHTCLQFIPNPKDYDLIVGGMDWGRTAPFAFLLIGFRKMKTRDGVSYNQGTIFMEVYGTEKTPEQWSEEIKAKLKLYNMTIKDINFIEGDPSMFTRGHDSSISIRDHFLREGIRIRKGSNDRVGGWENFHHWLRLTPDGYPYLTISQACPNLIRTLPELIHDENNVEDVETTRKNNIDDDAPDATRYALKAVKWIDAGVGGVGRTEGRSQPKRFASMEDGRQISMNLDKFEDAWTKRNKSVYYPR